MGGSFLVTPALLVMGYPSRVAVGSGLAFVFRTSVIATLKHRDLGQVDYKLGVLMIAGTTAGIEVGKEIVLHLEAAGMAGSIISVTYVFLLGGIGLFVTLRSAQGRRQQRSRPRRGRRRRRRRRHPGDRQDDPVLSRAADDLPPRGRLGFTVDDPRRRLRDRAPVSGFLGVGGGFIRMPALFYLIGVPVPIAVGTDLFGSSSRAGSAVSSTRWTAASTSRSSCRSWRAAHSGARVGSAATSIVDEGGSRCTSA